LPGMPKTLPNSPSHRPGSFARRPGVWLPWHCRGQWRFVFRVLAEREGRPGTLGPDQRRQKGMPFARPGEEKRTR